MISRTVVSISAEGVDDRYKATAAVVIIEIISQRAYQIRMSNLERVFLTAQSSLSSCASEILASFLGI
ncbi:MAG: hypothetical protein IK086_07095 [Clostridia bacterium]|nr:hypothetical protein [Clostridia bacterium]